MRRIITQRHRGTEKLHLYLLKLFLLFILLCLVNLPYAHSAVSHHIPLHSSLESDVQTLQSIGYLDELFYGSRPYSRMEVAKAVSKINRKDSPPIVKLILSRIEQALKEEILMIKGTRPPMAELKNMCLQTVYLDGKFSNGGLNKLQSIKNNNARDYENGLNMYGDISLLTHPFDAALLYLSPEFQYEERDKPGADELYRLRLREGYFKYHTRYSDIMFGIIPMWWGQGYHGAIILTDNIEPLTMLRFHKEEPFSLSLPFHQNWALTYDFFISRLEQDRKDYPNPVFWGMRIVFKPTPSWEIGMARTAMFGGGDRPVTLRIITRSITGIGENTSSQAGNQIAGFDTNYKGHIMTQPYNIYAEVYGEDEAGGLPSKYAYLAGLYLPDLAGLSGNSLRVEFADNTGLLRKEAGVWYRHGVYTDGYTYNGRIMGHGMGTDADDFFIKWEKYFSADVKGFLIFERNRIGLFNPVVSELRDYSAGIDMMLIKSISLNVNYTYQKVDNSDFSADKDFQNNELWVNVSFE